MNRRVRNSVVAALFALILVVQAPVASAAAMERDREPSFIQRIVRTIQKVVRPLAPATSEDDSYQPKPPRP